MAALKVRAVVTARPKVAVCVMVAALETEIALASTAIWVMVAERTIATALIACAERCVIPAVRDRPVCFAVNGLTNAIEAKNTRCKVDAFTELAT